MALDPKLLDIVIDNCTSFQEMSQFDRVSSIATQTPILAPIMAVWLLLGLLLFLYGLKSVGKTHRMLLVNENYFIVFIFWLLCGALLLFCLWKPYYILPFI